MAKVYSNIDYIDAVLSDSGEPTTPVNSWSTATTVGSGVSLTYDWMSSAPLTVPAGGFQAFNTELQDSALAAMALFAEVADITFTLDTANPADLEFGTVAFGGVPAGFTSGLTQVTWAILGNPAVNTYFIEADIYLTNSFASILDQTPGGTGFATMLHELAHGLGLEHTFENRLAPVGTDSEQYSVLSYTRHPDMFVSPQSLMLYDIAALQYLYGANTSTRTGDDIYSWGPGESAIMTLWDAGGVDKIDGANQTMNQTISLVEGTFSSIGGNGNGGDAVNNIAIAYGAEIENAEGGSGDDDLTGNSLANTLIGNAGDDELYGGSGDDILNGGADDDLLDGGEGIDTADFSSATSGVTVRLDLSTATATGEGNDTLVSIENIIGSDFADTIYGSNVTTTVNTIEAGEGADRVYAGRGTDIIDGGKGADLLIGDGEADMIFGGDDNDRIYGKFGNDTLHGGMGADLVVGDAANDTLYGNEGNDRLLGGTGNDILDGGDGADLYDGSSGEDVLLSSAGADRLNGRADADRYEFEPGNDNDRIFNFEDDIDTIAISNNFGFASAADIIANHTREVGNTVYIDLDPAGGDFIQVVNWLAGGIKTTADLEDDIVFF